MNIENVIEIPAGEFDLEMTQKSGQTSQPPWHEVGGEFRELLMVRGRPCPVAVRQRGRVLEVRPYLRVNRNDLKKRIEYIFDLKFDLEDFYSFLDDMGLSESIESSRGLRLFLAKDPFECIISSIASQNCSVLRWTRSIMDIRRMWGPAFRVSSETFHGFPSPEVLAAVEEDSLEELQRAEDDLPGDFAFNSLRACGVGYRAPYIRETSRILAEEIDVNEVCGMDYHEALEFLLELPGVGPKVADCILLYGFRKTEAFPVDVWVRRIMNYIYPERNFRDGELREFAWSRFGEMAGYVQLYLFNHARRSGLLEKLKGG
ncbi:DNA glycosylase [Methanothermobacter wolfeii]|uniref:DNA glycosylase n=1 Tax=Methanothermobacter wolfeii TaxID=145261 RepID=UPI0024B3B1A2|nr:DNA glycosylase [Methanothermobacter wolfeii]MDI6702612.1 DNA glycosylase [Methanothermobacter wolfeii]MDI6841829.1 DNA glycosylase [Methanothermobacter wolfeii]